MNLKKMEKGVNKKDEKRVKLSFHVFYGVARRKHAGTK